MLLQLVPQKPLKYAAMWHNCILYIQTFSLLASNLCLYIWWLESIIQIQMFLYFLVCIFNNYWMINFKINVLFYKEASFIAVYRSFKRHSDVPQLSYIVYRKKALMLFLFKVNGRKYWKISKPLLCEESILVPKSTKICLIDNISISFACLQNCKLFLKHTDWQVTTYNMWQWQCDM